LQSGLQFGGHPAKASNRCCSLARESWVRWGGVDAVILSGSGGRLSEGWVGPDAVDNRRRACIALIASGNRTLAVIRHREVADCL